jgi:hypothetical protein
MSNAASITPPALFLDPHMANYTATAFKAFTKLESLGIPIS